MKKFLGLAAAAACVMGAQSAQAIPTLVLTMSQASGTSAQCTVLGGVYSSGACSFNSTIGFIGVTGGYGDFKLNQELAIGFPMQAPPALWLKSSNNTAAASSITIALVASDYSTPVGAFPLLSTASGTLDAGIKVSLDSYYDVTNSGIAGVGTHLLDADWTGFASGAVPLNSTNVINDGDGKYSVSWILTVTRETAGALIAGAGVNGTLSQDVPAPGALALLGLGLLGIGATRRRTA